MSFSANKFWAAEMFLIHCQIFIHTDNSMRILQSLLFKKKTSCNAEIKCAILMHSDNQQTYHAVKRWLANNNISIKSTNSKATIV